jgi:hypothetical protein
MGSRKALHLEDKTGMINSMGCSCDVDHRRPKMETKGRRGKRKRTRGKGRQYDATKL